MITQMELCAIRPRLLASIRRHICNALLVLLCAQVLPVSAQGDATITANNTANNTADKPANLQLKPGRCVALHQGQVCYQRVQLQWRAQVGNYCLYQKGARHPLHCWQNVDAGNYVYAFASDTSVQLQLIDTQTQAIVAQAELEVAWVYKANTRRKTQWRLF
ncbi:MAG TPA: DUF3019 domain-containing protein [Cellvibrio sp.]|nr:DUF3019 domain-containing protein [Cellvibrio sp.]